MNKIIRIFLKTNNLLFQIEEGHVLHLVANPIEPSQPQNTASNNNANQNTSRNSNELDILSGIIRTISIET